MVCSSGSVKMAVLARLSDYGKVSQAITEKAEHQKLVAQYVQRELLEADDANLLVEEDMHVFDLNPLTDPLHLVCCNLCKKPVKDSQFVIHTELCRSSGIAEELLSELDGCKGNWKPSRKERKKSLTAGQRLVSTGVLERLVAVDASETAVSSSPLEEWGGNMPSCLEKAKGTPGTIADLAGEMIPLTKRPRLIAADTAQLWDQVQTAQGVSYITNFQDAIPYVPAPLAAKTYYSQRNNRLQAAVSRMYNQASMNECCMKEQEGQGNLIITEASSRYFSEEQLLDQFQKGCVHSSPITHGNQIFRQGSAASLVKEGGQASNNFVNEFPMITTYTSQAATDVPVTFHFKPYPFVGDSGASLTTIKRTTGSVPVI